jgi:DNA-binding GntR family transcriptional regulator
VCVVRGSRLAELPLAQERQAAGGVSPAPRATEVAYDKLCTAIVDLELAPGEMLNERELGDRLGVSRLTLLQALHRVAESGLVSVLPRRGILVAPVDILSAQQIFEARSVIEVRIAELAVERATERDIAHLRSLAEQLETLRGRADSSVSFPHLDRELHLSIAHFAGNRFLERALHQVWLNNQRLWNFFFRDQGVTRDYLFAHGDIVAAIEKHDAIAARSAVLEHIMSSQELLSSRLWSRL